MLNSFFMALSMFSRIPVPRIDFSKTNMKYILCFFPLIGAFSGIVQSILFVIMKRFDMNPVFISAVITAVPLIVTGGIHMDGFMDTSDARKSYGDREKKLKILSDPHIGAFSVISVIVYIVLYFGAVNALDFEGIVLFSKCFILSRCLSGLAGVSFKCAKREGLLFSFADSADSRFTKCVLLTVFVLCSVWIYFTHSIMGVAAVFVSVLVFAYYKHFAYKEFGGITGDLEGYFLQLCELMTVIVIAVTGKVF